MSRPCLCDREGCHRCWLYHNDERYRVLWGGPTRREEPLTFAEKAAAYARALAVRALGGFRDVTPEVRAARLKVCEGDPGKGRPPCPEFQADRTCFQCGCDMDEKTWWATAGCPLDRWAEANGAGKCGGCGAASPPEGVPSPQGAALSGPRRPPSKTPAPPG